MSSDEPFGPVGGAYESKRGEEEEEEQEGEEEA
jgi:hypothetical protein